MIGIERDHAEPYPSTAHHGGACVQQAPPDDRRARIVSLAARGRNRLAVAMPHWKSAQCEMKKIVGNATILALNSLLELTTQKLRT